MGFVERIRAGAREGAVNVTELVISLTNTVISKAAFGNRLGGVDPGVVRHMMKELTELLGTIAVSDVFPRLRWVDWATGLDARISRTAAELDRVIEKTLAEHEGSRGNDGEEVHDLLDGLLSIFKDGDQGFRLDRTDVKALILDMFIGGTDTIYKAIEWTMAELVKNPREMEKVQAEVRQVAAGTQGGVLEEELETMSLLHAAMKEALRLHPPIPLFPHESIQNTRLHGYDIPAKTRIMINAWAIGRDSESWEDADEFRPERFMDRAMDYNGKDPRFIPFGAGRRGCPGIAFGMRLAELTLANMMYHFDWMLPEGQDPESFEVVESNGFAPALQYPLILVAKPLGVQYLDWTYKLGFEVLSLHKWLESLAWDLGYSCRGILFVGCDGDWADRRRCDPSRREGSIINGARTSAIFAILVLCSRVLQDIRAVQGGGIIIGLEEELVRCDQFATADVTTVLVALSHDAVQVNVGSSHPTPRGVDCGHDQVLQVRACASTI
uniref:Cytochrome P450 71A1 n=1 Tax=Aegilops tauschii TaxID=37682 RepID=R7W6M8_AEGTA